MLVALTGCLRDYAKLVGAWKAKVHFVEKAFELEDEYEAYELKGKTLTLLGYEGDDATNIIYPIIFEKQ